MGIIFNMNGQHQSVINYFPKTKQQKEEEIEENMSIYIGGFPARILSRNGVSRRMLLSLLTLLNHTPGLIYSSIAVRQRNG